MKNINDLREEQSVIFIASSSEFTVKSINRETGNVIIHIQNVANTERRTDIKNIYPVTEHVKEVSKLTREVRDKIKTLIPFGVKINNKIMNDVFLLHWIAMCEAEENTKKLERAKVDFEIFVTALTNSLEKLDCLKVLDIPLLAPMFTNPNEIMK